MNPPARPKGEYQSAQHEGTPRGEAPLRQTATTLAVETQGRGFTELMARRAAFVAQAALATGLLTVFVRHTSASLVIQENADPAVRAALTATQPAIPVQHGQLVLGTWQGVSLWEHRQRPHRRELALHLLGA